MPQSHLQDTIELTSEQVLNITVETLTAHLDLDVQGHNYTSVDIWRVLTTASAQARAIEARTQQLDAAPSANTIRYHLRQGLLESGSSEAGLLGCSPVE